VVLEQKDFEQWVNGNATDAAGLMKPAGEDVLQKWPVSKRVNSSKADADDATLIEPVELAAAYNVCEQSDDGGLRAFLASVLNIRAYAFALVIQLSASRNDRGARVNFPLSGYRAAGAPAARAPGILVCCARTKPAQRIAS